MSKVTIIAEAGVNHNGKLELAKQLVDVAASAGADIVKFQIFEPRSLVSKHALKAQYQKQNTGGSNSQLEMIQSLQLSQAEFLELEIYCKAKKIQFLATAFDLKSLDFLTSNLDMPFIKIASGDINFGQLLLSAASSGKPVILSTGMAIPNEIQDALGVLAFGYLHKMATPSLEAFRKAGGSEEGKRVLREKVILLHCTTEYPAPMSDVNLRAMLTLSEDFNLPVGYSDHTEGIAIPIAAVAMGASVIEKHFTLDKTMEGPDHKASLEPHELVQMIKSIRNVEVALGSRKKIRAPAEEKNVNIARRSLMASVAIKRGEEFTTKNLIAKRPANGISPMLFWEYLGKMSDRDYQEDDFIVDSQK